MNPAVIAMDNEINSELSIAHQITKLEQQYKLPVNNNLSYIERLSIIEKKIFGFPQNGSLLTRLQRLDTAPVVGAAEDNYSNKDNFLQDSLPLVNVAPVNFVRIGPFGSTKINSDYLNEIMQSTKGKVLRFKTMPITVYISRFPDPNFTRAIVLAFETWENSTNHAVRFAQVNDPNAARIQVTWKHLGNAPDSKDCLLGAHTVTKYTKKGKGNLSVIGVGGIPIPIYIPKSGPKYKVPPQIIEINLDMIMSKNMRIRYKVLQNVVTHELGHALGLIGHSPNKTDIMYPITDEYSRLSQQDINTLLKLYQQKVEIPL
jgi:hypothetical protein